MTESHDQCDKQNINFAVFFYIIVDVGESNSTCQLRTNSIILILSSQQNNGE